MSVLKRKSLNFSEHSKYIQNNGLYVHSNPPRVLHLTSAHLKQLIRGGDIDKLEQIVLEGQGKKLIGEYSADYKTRTFLKSIPTLMSKISLLHDAVNSGNVNELRDLLDEEPEKKKKLVMAKDEAGVGLLHKAVYYDLKDIYRYLIEKFPFIVNIKDSEGRTAYHYTPMCKDINGVQKLLINAGAETTTLDFRQRSAKYYRDHIQELELPSILRSATHSRKGTGYLERLNFKKSNLRIWIHQRNLANLQQVVWEGHGAKLLVEHSNNPKVKKFLEAVPYIMGLIKDVHSDVIKDDLDSIKKNVSPPIPEVVLCSKDSNGLTPLHKAAGLGRQEIAAYIIEKNPASVNIIDAEGRTPLHYAALLKDDGKMMNFLLDHGADESVLDNKQKTAAYYKTRHSELDAKLLNVIPECPRLASKDSFIKAFDWGMLLNISQIEEPNKVLKRSIDTISNGKEIPEKESITPQEIDKDDHELKENIDANNNNNNKNNNNYKKNEENKHSEIKESDNKNITNKEVENKNITNKKVENKNNINDKTENKIIGKPSITTEKEFHSESLILGSPNLNDENIDDGEMKENNTSPEKRISQVNSGKSERLLSPEIQSKSAGSNKSAKSTSSSTHSNKMNNINIDSMDNTPKTPNVSRTNSENTPDLLQEQTKTPAVSRTTSKNSSHSLGNEEHVSAKSRTSTKTPSVSRNNSKNNLFSNEDENNISNVPPPRSDSKISESSVKSTSKTPTISRTSSKNTSSGKQTKTPNVSRSNSKDVEVESVGVIEGVVNGENEVESTNEEGQDKQEDDAEILAMIEEGNMERLAGVVLNGEGEKLIGQSSNNPELQAFLDNVPIYMSKIKRIHTAAKDGNLKDLQAALDRRKFAIAKDSVSPNGASPLHSSVIFGNTSIVRYLAGRFPETVQVTDNNGRTPLHYAAILADNGHYYNLLLHLGSNPKSEDNFGKTPEYYRNHQENFNHKSVLKEFGAEIEPEDMLSDKVNDDKYSARKDFDDEDMLGVLNRCFNVLHSRRNSNTSVSSTSSSALNYYTNSLISKLIKQPVFDSIKTRLTKLDHNLYDVIWPSVKKLPADSNIRNALQQDCPVGIIAPDYYVYYVFNELLEPIIKNINSLNINQEIKDHPESKFFENKDGENAIIDLDLDPGGKHILTGTLKCTRNLDDFELPNCLSINQLETVERLITTVLLSDEMAKALYPNATDIDLADKGGGVYYTLNEILEDPSEPRVLLASNNLLIPLWNIPESDRLHGKHWPYGRGVFLSNGSNLAVWVNVLDHIRIVTCTSTTKPGNIGLIYARLHRLMDILNKYLTFKHDDKLGYLSARPTALGNTLHFNLTLRFPNLIKEPNNLRHLCVVRGLNFFRNNNTTNIVQISNQQCLGITEMQCIDDFATAVDNILQLEKDLSLSNSLHIAVIFANFFKRKKIQFNNN